MAKGGFGRGVLAAALAVAILVVFWLVYRAEPEPKETALTGGGEAPAVAAQVPAQEPRPAGLEAASAPEAVAEAEPAVPGTKEQAASAAAPEAPPSPPPPPALDLVRVEPDGSAIIAGRAEPGSGVEIVIGGAVVGAAEADGDGAFIAFLKVDPESGAQAVTARAAPPSPSTAGEQAPVASPPPPAESAPILILGGGEAGAAPVVVRPGPEGTEILQPAPRPATGVSLDIIDYDDAGRVRLSGHAAPGSEIRLYLDGAPLGVALAAASGAWAWETAGVAAGAYALRLDEVTPNGVRSRIETPFLREAAEIAAAAPGAFTVQRGDSLWRIAASVYGQGLRYTLIYGANRAVIRDPDLIYPGQIFTLPEPPR